jgi:hypothetical protein
MVLAMINWLITKLRSYQLKLALKQGKFKTAQNLLQEIERSGIQLSWLEKLYQQQLKIEQSLVFYRQEVAHLSQCIQKFSLAEQTLKPNLEFINYIYNSFNLKERDRFLFQCTGIESQIFSDLELALVDYLETEINKIPEQIRCPEINKAVKDLEGLKQGIDPQYNHRLSSHIYLLKYFLDNIYCSYLAWFLIYQQNLLLKNLKILDLAAGPGTVIFGLALLLSSTKGFFPVQETQITYYSLEQQADLQYRGLQFWRKYIESLSTPINAYCRFNTIDLFDYENYAVKLPSHFFDFIIISHCFFYESQQRYNSHQIYRQIFEHNLVEDGHAVLIIQGRKLFNMYSIVPSEDLNEEVWLIQKFLEELGLKLEWYKYLTSTGKRIPMKQGFAQFAKDNLPPQNYLNVLRKKYLQQKYPSNYAIDDYIILAKKA